jgi:hypothetical protein
MLIQIYFAFTLLNNYKVISSFLFKKNFVISNFVFSEMNFSLKENSFKEWSHYWDFQKPIFFLKIKKGWARDRIAISIGGNSKIHIKQWQL